MNGVEVIIKKGNFPTPYGLHYKAKGAYVQGNSVIVVGRLEPENTIRIKYPKENVTLTFF